MNSFQHFRKLYELSGDVSKFGPVFRNTGNPFQRVIIQNQKHKSFVGHAVVFAPDPQTRCGKKAKGRIVIGMAQDDDEGRAGGPHCVDARPDERLSDALPLQRGKDGSGRKAHAVQEAIFPLDDSGAEELEGGARGMHQDAISGISPLIRCRSESSGSRCRRFSLFWARGRRCGSARPGRRNRPWRCRRGPGPKRS